MEDFVTKEKKGKKVPGKIIMHLANANKRNHIRFLNTKLGLFIPGIITPLELFEEEKFVYQ
jgi:hypothetical protein